MSLENFKASQASCHARVGTTSAIQASTVVFIASSSSHEPLEITEHELEFRSKSAGDGELLTAELLRMNRRPSAPLCISRSGEINVIKCCLKY